MVTLFITLAIFVVTLLLIMLRPFGMTEAAAALIGAVLMLLTRSIEPLDVVLVISRQWNVYGFFLGLMTISALADRAGVFEWMAHQAGVWARGSALRLYVAVFAVGTFITTFQSNDATALILTPIVFALVTRLRLSVLPFMFACTFIADTASFVLPVSNPTNILVLDVFGMDLGAFLRYLLLPSLFCIIVNTAAFVWIFRGDLRQSYALSDLAVVEPVNPAFFRYTLGVLALTGVSYVIASLFGLPLSFVALGGAGVLLAGAALGPNLTTVGSLATMLWIVILRRKGLEISPRVYIKLGFAVVPLMIVVGSVMIALSP